MPRLACTALAVVLLAGCHPEPPWGIDRWGSGGRDRVAAGGTISVELYRYGDPEPGLGTVYPVQLHGPFEVAAVTADGVTLRATGAGAGRLEIRRGTEVIVDAPLAAYAATDLELAMYHVVNETSGHPDGAAVLLGATFTVDAAPVHDGLRLVDESGSITLSGIDGVVEAGGRVTPASPGLALIEYRSAGLSRELAIEVVADIDEIAVLPPTDGATVCFEPRFEGAAVTGVPFEITAAVPLRIFPSYCATPTGGPFPATITARYGTISATAVVP